MDSNGELPTYWIWYTVYRDYASKFELYFNINPFLFIFPMFSGEVSVSDSLLVEDSGAKRRRRRRAVDDDYMAPTEINWETAEDEAKAVQLCKDNFQCQFDFFSTKDESLANTTASNQMKFEEEQAVLGKYYFNVPKRSFLCHGVYEKWYNSLHLLINND